MPLSPNPRVQSPNRKRTKPLPSEEDDWASGVGKTFGKPNGSGIPNFEGKKLGQRRRDRRRNAFILMKKRRRIVHDYQARRATVCESMAAQQTAERFGIGVSTLRRWTTDYRRHGKRGLLDKVSHRVGSPSKLSSVVVGFIVLLRTRLGWGAQRIAAELKSKGIANISHQTVHRAFKKYHLPTKTYHPKGKSNGIRYKRYRKQAPNQMWHLDFGHRETRKKDH